MNHASPALPAPPVDPSRASGSRLRGAYRAPRPRATPLFQIVNDHVAGFPADYDERYRKP